MYDDSIYIIKNSYMTSINPNPPVKPTDNSNTQYIVIQNTGFINELKLFIYGHVIPSLYSKVYGPDTKEACQLYIKTKR